MFLISCIRNGFYSSKYPEKYTQQQAKELIAKLLIKPEYYDEIDLVLKKYVSPLLLDNKPSPFLV